MSSPGGPKLTSSQNGVGGVVGRLHSLAVSGLLLNPSSNPDYDEDWAPSPTRPLSRGPGSGSRSSSPAPPISASNSSLELEVDQHPSKFLMNSMGLSPVVSENDFCRVRLKADKGNEGPELIAAAKSLLQAVSMRKKYTSRSYSCLTDGVESITADLVNGYVVEQGVFQLVQANGTKLTSHPPVYDFIKDYQRIVEICDDGPVKSFTYYQLKKLDAKWKFHHLLNDQLEKELTRLDPKDFSTVVKVDTHIHLAAGMTANQLLTFIQHKSQTALHDVVSLTPAGQPITLKDVFDKMGIDIANFTVEMLDVHADNTFQRFDKFNTKYNPFGKSELRDIFLKTSNHMRGQYFAELTKELFRSLEETNYIKTECRLSIYGRSTNEWTSLAKWANEWNVYSGANQWMIQIPRIYSVFKISGSIGTFQDMLSNIFEPLFKVTLNPDYDPDLHIFLQHVSGFDSVDDESRADTKLSRHNQIYPAAWNTNDNPPYHYYLYFMWANLSALNQLRALKGLNTFDLRPHCGESGDTNHLAAAFLLAKHINHGINLSSSTSLQYLYYLEQIGLAVSPLSNDSLFLDLKRNPFPTFFRRGLNVSLSTDDPLQFHLTQTPLIEEYSVALQRWHMSGIDISEIARNSVYQSGFPHDMKKSWLGPDYLQPGVDGNDIRYTNVPDVRVIFRSETLVDEFKFLERLSTKLPPPPKVIPSSFAKIYVEYPSVSKSDPVLVDVCQQVQEALAIRAKYTVPHTEKKDSLYEYHMKDGVFLVFDRTEVLCSHDQEDLAAVYCTECNYKYCSDCDRVIHKSPSKRGHHRAQVEEAKPILPVVTFDEFLEDYINVIAMAAYGPTISFCQKRLGLLEASFEYHKLMNDRLEKKAAALSLCDWEHTVKVDTHVHASAGMKDKDLLEFIKRKIQENPTDLVLEKEGKAQTLKQVFDEMGIPLEHFTLDSLDMKVEGTFKRFDFFKSKYNPFGHGELRSIFLKPDNYMKGKYFAELVKNTLKKSEANPCIKMEYRISIYGRRKEEWNSLSSWVIDNKVHSEQNKWVIQVPRMYHVLKEANELDSFQDMLIHIFGPLFEVTLDPASNPVLHEFLKRISGFDSVDDENHSERKIEYALSPPPGEWKTKENPPYAYYSYYIWANLQSLNYFRKKRGFNTFTFRPHCGQTGDVNHLVAGFFFATSISHGLNLVRSPVLQYLYYLAQIGISVSPLGENTMFTTYEHNPFVHFFKRGLNCSLSTDNPLMLHITTEPLIEEYTIAAKVWKLSITDLSEIARNSVLQSGFNRELKSVWLGEKFDQPGVAGNDASKTNVPNIRVCFRNELYMNELAFLHHQQSLAPSSGGEGLEDQLPPLEGNGIGGVRSAHLLLSNSAFHTGCC